MLACVARPRPIYVIGDSQAAVFADRVYQAPGESSQFIVRAKYLPGVTAAGFADADGTLHAMVMAALTSECLIVPDDDGALKAIHRVESAHWRYAAVTMGWSRRSPVIVLMCGSLDVAQVLYELGTGAGDASVSTEDLMERVERRIAAFEAGLRTLRSYGLEDIFVHSVAPTHPDDQAWQSAIGFFAPAMLRYKVSLMINDRLARAAEATGTDFIDLWPDAMDGASMRPEFALDVCHVNGRGALTTINRVVERLNARE